MDVTLLIPHFQTLDAIRLCLRSIRRYTEPAPRVLVLDNGSRNASREYLGSLAWIELPFGRCPAVRAQPCVELGGAHTRWGPQGVIYPEIGEFPPALKTAFPGQLGAR